VTILNRKGFEASLQDRVNNKLNSLLSNSNQIDKSIAYALSNPGKRVRPILIYLVGDALKIPKNNLDSIAVASEIIHTYSLVHDDLPCMDDDDLRRGKPTLHKQYSESTAVLAGDAMQSLAIQIILEDKNISSEIKVMITKFLMKTIGHKGMILGQALDIEFEELEVSKDQIIQMNHLKTGLLIEFCILAPVLIANKRNEQWENIASSVGIAFQLIDDLLDLEESVENLGKATNKDLNRNKKSAPLVIGIPETLEEIHKYEAKTMESVDNLGLNNHPLTNYLKSLFYRRK
jgi:geranylgeranyl pyrophosphate synthase